MAPVGISNTRSPASEAITAIAMALRLYRHTGHLVRLKQPFRASLQAVQHSVGHVHVRAGVDGLVRSIAYQPGISKVTLSFL